MFYLLFGEDNYRSKKKLSQIIKQYKDKNKSCLSLFFFSYEKGVNFSDIELATKQTSMFSEKKLIIISGLFSAKKLEDQNNILDLLKKTEHHEDIFFIFYDFKILASNKLLKYLKNKNIDQIQEFKLLKGVKINNWINREFSKHNIRIEKDALNLLIDCVGSDIWRIQNEINKLSNFCQLKKVVNFKDVSLLVQSKQDLNIFQTIEAIASKDEKKALELISAHIKKGDNELYILSMIAYQFKSLLTIKDLINSGKDYEKISKELKIHPFVLRKNFKQAMLFRASDLKNIYNKILETDLAIKQGANPQLEIELLVLEN